MMSIQLFTPTPSYQAFDAEVQLLPKALKTAQFELEAIDTSSFLHVFTRPGSVVIDLTHSGIESVNDAHCQARKIQKIFPKIILPVSLQAGSAPEAPLISKDIKVYHFGYDITADNTALVIRHMLIKFNFNVDEVARILMGSKLPRLYALDLSGIQSVCPGTWQDLAVKIQDVFQATVIYPQEVNDAVKDQKSLPRKTLDVFPRILKPVRHLQQGELLPSGDSLVDLIQKPRKRFYFDAKDNLNFTVQKYYLDGIEERAIETQKLKIESQADMRLYTESLKLRDRYCVHFTTRFHLFLNLAIAVFNRYPAKLRSQKFSEPVFVLRERTNWQTATSGFEWSACHSAIISDVFIGLNENFFNTKILNDFDQDDLENILSEIKSFYPTFDEAEFESFVLNIKSGTSSGTTEENLEKLFLPKALIPIETYLKASLSGTFELPCYVNSFDGLIESTCRKKAVALINQCFRGEIEPGEALLKFRKHVEDFLSASDQEIQLIVQRYQKLAKSFGELSTEVQSLTPDFFKLIDLWSHISIILKKIKASNSHCLKTAFNSAFAQYEKIFAPLEQLRILGFKEFKFAKTTDLPGISQLFLDMKASFKSPLSASELPIFDFNPVIIQDSDRKSFGESRSYSQTLLTKCDEVGYFIPKSLPAQSDVLLACQKVLKNFQSNAVDRKLIEDEMNNHIDLLNISAEMMKNFDYLLLQMAPGLADVQETQKLLLMTEHAVAKS